jgi:hypothetical protein
MSLIKPRTRGKQFVQYRTRLDRENHETLHAYAAFLGEDAAYVLNELIDTVLAKDKEFITWRAEHPQKFAPGALVARPPEPRDRARSGPAAPALVVSPSAPNGTRP